jgi:hypothetical protein
MPFIHRHQHQAHRRSWHRIIMSHGHSNRCSHWHAQPSHIAAAPCHHITHHHTYPCHTDTGIDTRHIGDRGINSSSHTCIHATTTRMQPQVIIVITHCRSNTTSLHLTSLHIITHRHVIHISIDTREKSWHHIPSYTATHTATALMQSQVHTAVTNWCSSTMPLHHTSSHISMSYTRA